MANPAIQLLQKNNIKYSKQRENLLTILMNQKQPISIEQLFDLVKAANVDMNLSTVYRIVETLESHGLVEKSYNSITQANMFLYKRVSHTHYMVCVACHQLIPIKTCPMGAIIENVESSYGFKVTSHQLEISGYCKDCAQNL